MHAVKHQLTLTFYNIADDDLPLFREAGFQITKWGEEALVDLADCRWEGKAYEWVRRQSNYCRRRGLEFAECIREEMSADAWSELLAELCEVHPAAGEQAASGRNPLSRRLVRSRSLGPQADLRRPGRSGARAHRRLSRLQSSATARCGSSRHIVTGPTLRAARSRS